MVWNRFWVLQAASASQTGGGGPRSCLSKKKDIRKFLDGIYVSSHGVKEDWEGHLLQTMGKWVEDLGLFPFFL